MTVTTHHPITRHPVAHPAAGAAPSPRVEPSRLVPRGSLPRRPSDDLLRLAHEGLEEAARAVRPADRYAGAHLAALRAAAALLAARARPAAPGTPRRRPASAWRLLASVAPEFAEWAAFFAAGAAKRAAAEAGVSTAVTTREADDLLRDATAFLAAIGAALGGPTTLRFPRSDRI